MNEGKIELIGIKHFKEGMGEVKNYQKVKEYLEQEKPGFITCELRLHDPLLRFYFGATLTTPADGLDSLENEITKSRELGSEYKAAIIYSRRNNVPLYFIDLNRSSPEEVASVNVAEVNPEVVWDDKDGSLGSSTDGIMWDTQERNRFMASVLREVVKRNPGTSGVHIGGATHYREDGQIEPLQQIMSDLNPSVKFLTN